MIRTAFLVGLSLFATAPLLAQSAATPAPAAASGAVPVATGEKLVRENEGFQTLNRFYPARALAAKEQGLVGFLVRLDRDAHATTCEVTFSSGFRQLDQETCALVMAHAVFRPELDKQGQRQPTVREGVINWKLPSTDRMAIPAIPVAVTAANTPDKVICKRRQKSESYAAFERVCMTKHDWEMDRDQSREAYGAQQGVKGFSGGAPTFGVPPGG